MIEPRLPLAGLQRLREYAAQRGRSAGVRPDERCEMCGAAIDPTHGHVVGLERRALMCVCRPCYLLFTHDGAGGGRFRAVPTRYEHLAGFRASGPAWAALDIPIGLVFLLRNGASGRVSAFYPSPAGATESELALDAWDAVVEETPALASLTPDVEALLVRQHAHGTTALIVPIDVCYELVGRLKRGWRGFQGGEEVWRDIDGFFADVESRATGGAA